MGNIGPKTELQKVGNMKYGMNEKTKGNSRDSHGIRCLSKKKINSRTPGSTVPHEVVAEVSKIGNL